MRIHAYENEGAGVRTMEDVPARATLAEVLEIDETVLMFAVGGDGRQVDVGVAIEEIFINVEIPRVVAHPGHHINVVVNYGGLDADEAVSPGTLLEVIRRHAIERLGIGEQLAVDLGLRLPGGQEDLPLHAPIASVAKGQDHVRLELVSIVRPQG